MTKQADISKHNSEGKDQVLLLMISDSKRWHYREVKILSALMRRVTSKETNFLA